MTNENNKSDFELQMEQLYMWKLLEEKCRKNGDRRTPALIFKSHNKIYERVYAA